MFGFPRIRRTRVKPYVRFQSKWISELGVDTYFLSADPRARPRLMQYPLKSDMKSSVGMNHGWNVLTSFARSISGYLLLSFQRLSFFSFRAISKSISWSSRRTGALSVGNEEKISFNKDVLNPVVEPDVSKGSKVEAIRSNAARRVASSRGVH